MSRDVPDALIQWLQQLAPGLPAPVREYRFHGVRRWTLDLFFPVYLVGIECHGAVFARGRHNRGYGFTNDRVKMNEAQLAGILILEFTAEQIDDGPDYCIDQIKRALGRRGWNDSGNE